MPSWDRIKLHTMIAQCVERKDSMLLWEEKRLWNGIVWGFNSVNLLPVWFGPGYSKLLHALSLSPTIVGINRLCISWVLLNSWIKHCFSISYSRSNVSYVNFLKLLCSMTAYLNVPSFFTFKQSPFFKTVTFTFV